MPDVKISEVKLCNSSFTRDIVERGPFVLIVNRSGKTRRNLERTRSQLPAARGSRQEAAEPGPESILRA